MKKKVIGISASALILILVIVYYLPQSLYKIDIPNSKITVYENTAITINGVTHQDTHTYEFVSGTESYNKLVSILDKYSYHRNLSTLFTSNGYISSENSMYDISFDGEHIGNLTIFDSGKVLIYSRSYKIGYWGNSKQNKFMDEFEEFLSTQTTVEQ